MSLSEIRYHPSLYMQDKPDSLHTLGLDFTLHSIRGIQLSKKRGKPTLEKIYEIPIQRSSHEDSETVEYVSPQHDLPFQGALNKNLIVTSLPASATLVRQIEVKLKKISDIDAVLSFQAEPTLPYPVENCCLDRIVIGDTAEGKLLTLLSARKDHLKQQLDLWHQLEIEPEVMTAASAALAAFVHYFEPNDQLQGVIHIGEVETCCLFMREGLLIAAQVCFMGSDHLKTAAKLDRVELFEQLDFASISKENYPHLAESLEQLRMEITRTLYALSKQSKGQDIQKLIGIGEVILFPHFASALLQPLERPFTILNTGDPHLQKFAIPFGSALLGMPGAEQINFRQGEFSYPKPWRRYQQPIVIYLGLCAVLALAILFAGRSAIKYREDSLRHEYAQLLESLNKPYTQFEKRFSKKKGDEEGSVTPVEQLTQDDLWKRLQFLQKDIQSAPEHYPFLPNIPTVSDVLAWLSTHPKVVEKDSKTNELTPLLQLETFNYTLHKRPEQSKKNEKYQAKVELEFSSVTPKAAREFHDALIAPNNIVDPKGEVKWSTNRGLYRASFFLKDKTIYSTAGS